MATRLSRLIGLAAIALVVLRLGRVLDRAEGASDWRLIVVAAALGGAMVSWAALSYGASLRRLVWAHALGVLVVVTRVTAAASLRWGLVPRSDTPTIIGDELAQAFDILRFGAPPVVAVPGVVALVAVVLWVLGAVWTWAAITGRTWVGILTPLGFYLYIAVLDRATTPWSWATLFAVVAAASLAATGRTDRPGLGKLRDRDHRPLTGRRLESATAVVVTAVLVGLAATTIAAPTFTGPGAIDWRTNSVGDGTGAGVSLNRFVGLRQSLSARTDEPVFVASLEGDLDTAQPLYWKLVTLDRYDGSFWLPGDTEFSPANTSGWENPSQEFRGDTTPITQTIRIEGLREDRLPVLYSPVSVNSDNDLVRSGAEAGSDGSLRINAVSRQGLTYRVESNVPTLNVAALASENGELSPLFARAASAGLYDGAPGTGSLASTPLSIVPYLDLPDDTDPLIAELAASVTAEATTPFEQALLLEDFLRGFDYDIDVTSGHSSLELAAWLTDPSSPNYRRGYCEQFATAMAVMGRTVGLPTRVVIGFTPGETIDTSDGPVRVVRQRNAHAWVEVWMDSQGWVRFDPTPRGDVATTPTAAAVGFDPGDIDLADPADAGTPNTAPPLVGDIPNTPAFDFGANPDSGSVDRGFNWWWLAVAFALAVTTSVPVVKLTRRKRRRRLAKTGDITAAWEQITEQLGDLGSGPLAHQTPLEFAMSTDHALVSLAAGYSAHIYGGETPDDAFESLSEAEEWVNHRFGPKARARALFSLRSVLPGRWRRR